MKFRIGDFNLTIDKHHCVQEIRPNLRCITERRETVGAVGDDNAVHTEAMTEFFDPKARGDVRIFDELQKSYISLKKKSSTPHFRASQSWSRRKNNCVEWTLEIKHTGGKERELSVELVLPQPIFPGSIGSGHAKWHLWGPAKDAPYKPDYGLKQFHHCKCIDEETDVPLPLFTLFDPRPESDIGLSYLLPPDQVWYTDFRFDQRNWLTTVRFNNLGLIKAGTITLKLWMFSHRGCYRSAVEWVRNRFPVLFAPVKGQEKVDGNMAYTIPLIPEKRTADWVQNMNYKWNELFQAREFGNYVPPDPFDCDHFVTDEHPEWAVYGVTYEKLNNYIEMCHRHGVNVMPYFNVGECESEIAERDFKDSIARTVTGDKLITWKYYDKRQHNILMNCDPAYSWCDAVLDQFRQLKKKLPGIDGFWYDQMGYGWIDTAHFDGSTFYNNRPAYNMTHMYMRALKRMRHYFPGTRMNGMGNAPVRWQLMEFLDGAMSEGSEEFMDRLSPICPERPTVLLAEGETAFQNALLYGSNLHVSPYYRYPTTEALPRDAVRLFKMYNPLLEFLTGRKWVYDPNPLAVSWKPPSIYRGLINQQGNNLKSNIYKDPMENYIIPITVVTKGVMTSSRFIEDVKVDVRVKDGAQLKKAVIFGVDYKGYYVKPVKQQQDGSLTITVPKHGVASMVVLTKDVKKLKGNREWLKFKEHQLS